jgi:predicted secreted protein
MQERPSDSSDFLIPSSITLAVGEEWHGRLPGLGSAGFAWSVEADVPGIVQTRVTPVELRADESGGVTPPDSFSTAEEVMLLAMRPGEVRIALIQARSWEKERPPHRRHEIRVRVVE